MTDQGSSGKGPMVKPQQGKAPPETIKELFDIYCKETVLRPASKETSQRRPCFRGGHWNNLNNRRHP
jgi:hypothetical protein